MKIRVTTEAYYGEQRRKEGDVIEYDGKDMPSWGESLDVPDVPAAKDDAEEEEEECTLHQIASKKKSKVAKPGGVERSGR